MSASLSPVAKYKQGLCILNTENSMRFHYNVFVLTFEGVINAVTINRDNKSLGTNGRSSEEGTIQK